MGTQREKNMGLEGVFMGSIMGDEISEHSSACHRNSCKILWVPIMPGTQILWVPDFFYSGTFHNFLLVLIWVQEDGRRARIVYPVEKTWMQQGLNL
jgi:hypothetical protein